MDKITTARGATFGVLLIPSRERVFHDYLRARDVDLPPELHTLVRVEAETTSLYQREFAPADIRSVDLLRFVRDSLESDKRVYPARNDAHPLAPGYRAGRVRSVLRQRRALS